MHDAIADWMKRHGITDPHLVCLARHCDYHPAPEPCKQVARKCVHRLRPVAKVRVLRRCPRGGVCDYTPSGGGK